MAKKYKVKVIKILLKNNKTAVSGDIVSGDKLINELEAVKGGYVVEEKSEPKESDKGKENENLPKISSPKK